MDRLSDLEFFLIVSRHETLKNAAGELGLTASAVSQRLSALESRLGVVLTLRTSHKLVLTEEGRQFKERGKEIFQSYRQLEDHIRNIKHSSDGLIRINSSFGIGRRILAPVLSEFKRQNPNISLEMILSEKPADLVGEDFDLCIWAGVSPAMPYVAKKLLTNRQVFCASPEYLKQVGEISDIEDLLRLGAIALMEDEDAQGVMRIFNRDRSKLVKIPHKLLTNDGEVALRWCLDGFGVLMRSQWRVKEYFESGELVQVLPQWGRDADICALYPDRKVLNRRTSLLLRFLKKRLTEKLGKRR